MTDPSEINGCDWLVFNPTKSILNGCEVGSGSGWRNSRGRGNAAGEISNS